MPKTPNNGRPWSKREVRTLRAHARRHTPVKAVAKQLGRTIAAAQQKALREGIAFRA